LNAWAGGEYSSSWTSEGMMMAVGARSAMAVRIARSSTLGSCSGTVTHLDVLAGHVLEQGEQVDFLLVGAAHRAAAGLADDRDHRHVIELGVVQAVQQVNGAWR